ncbi:MAG TPA: L-glutamate gamma-semialdehyde dehydrogenase [Bacilli bacterium]|nr:L-glutamate gamma-semialdehyde dehydrogenase [Bacilli bacterium]HPX84136.1 L-glutamate gamma-semialdehyde dehydrogenase [Bacilli bacterium]HQC74429.1 L-glutamate gamma-semialdehyde dehydrogenase [Bacilli bacterium]
MYEYKTEELLDFSLSQNQEAYQKALKSLPLGKTYPLIIGGKRIETSRQMISINPALISEVIGIIHQASLKEAELAMATALESFKTWSLTSPQFRADVLFKAAAIIRRRKFFFSALMTKEAGKPWVEADADTAEAIDFLEYYGRQILELQHIDAKVQSRPKMERNEYRYIPLGVGAIITPWNFPLAILTGMTAAAVVSGNTVLLKPASPTQVIAYHFVQVMEEAGLPAGVINFIPGRGSEIGEWIVNHPKTRFISFTGSKEVGIAIYEKAAKVQKGQIWLKRVIAEMGGKDAILVDAGVDAEAAADAIVKSAFGFSGQKCSACSRAIIHQDKYAEVLDLIIKKTKALKVGNPESSDTQVGPVIDEAAFDRIMAYMAIGKKEGRLVLGGTGSKEHGYFINPTVVCDVSPQSKIMQEEIFGPYLAVCSAKSFEEGLEIVNNTEYGLTGAVFSNNRHHLEMARQHFHVGNLYINRKCTGAIVGYQPFGGFNMSGTDSKAGGPDYLVLHMQGKSICEQL